MGAIPGGLGAAIAWATATVSSSRSSRMIGAPSVLAWVMLVGFVVMMPFSVWQFLGAPRPGTADWVWLAIAGGGNLIGLLLEYAGLAVGKVGIVAPIASTEGAIAAVVAAVAGERISPLVGALLGIITVGVVMAAVAPDERDPEGRRAHTGAATAYGVGAALVFGIAIYGSGRLAQDLPLAVVLVPARVIGVFALLLPLAVAGGLRWSGRAAPYVVLSGFCEIGGFACFVLGARHGIAIASVLGAQFAAFSAIGAFLLYRERLRRFQVAGVAVIVGGVAALAAIHP